MPREQFKAMRQCRQVAPSGGQICNLCKWRHVVAKFNPIYGVNFWVRCASGNVFKGFCPRWKNCYDRQEPKLIHIHLQSVKFQIMLSWHLGKSTNLQQTFIYNLLSSLCVLSRVSVKTSWKWSSGNIFVKEMTFLNRVHTHDNHLVHTWSWLGLWCLYIELSVTAEGLEQSAIVLTDWQKLQNHYDNVNECFYDLLQVLSIQAMHQCLF